MVSAMIVREPALGNYVRAQRCGRNASPGFGPACHAENVVRRDWMSYCLAKPGAWRDEPWEGDLVVKVGGKIFAFLGENGASPAIGLKCGDRETADLLIERYPGA
jgi:hypothetical protein